MKGNGFRVSRTVLENILMRKAQNISVISLLAKKQEMRLFFRSKAFYMRERSRKESKMGMELKNLLMVIHLWVLLKMESFTGRASINGRMEVFMKASFSRVRGKGKVSLYLQTETSFKDNTSKI